MATESNPNDNQPTNESSSQSTHNTVREREVIVTDNGRDRSGVGGLMIGLIGLVVLIVVAVIGINLIGGSSDGGPSVDVPSEVDINVPDSGGSGG